MNSRLSLGLDSGSTMTKGALFDGAGIRELSMLPTSVRPRDTLSALYQKLIKPECYTVTTGYGRKLLPQADKIITEITCHARGAVYLCPGCRAVIDIGGQDCKAILLDRDGNVADFLMNDKCAAGTGRFVEMMLNTLEIEPDRLEDVVKDATAVTMSSMCTVFAESEMVSLLANGAAPGDIALGIIHSICKRTANFAGRLPMDGQVYFSGGLASYPVVVRTLEYYLKRPVVTHEYSQYTGAIGAAVIGWQKQAKGVKG